MKYLARVYLITLDLLAHFSTLFDHFIRLTLLRHVLFLKLTFHSSHSSILSFSDSVIGEMVMIKNIENLFTAMEPVLKRVVGHQASQ